MFNMIKADIYRLVRSVGIYIFLLVILGTYSISIATKSAGGVALGMMPQFAPEIKIDIKQMGFNFTWFFVFIIPVFVILLSDFSEKTIKNTVSSAISRKKYFLTKAAMIELFVVVSFVFINLLYYATNRLINGEKYSSDFSDFFMVILKQLPIFLFIGAVFIALAVIVKRAAAFNAIAITAPIAYTTIALILFAIKATKKFAEKVLLEYDINYMVAQMASGATETYRNTCLTGACIGTVLALVLGYWLFTKREIV